eukprot:gene12583-biopygen11185
MSNAARTRPIMHYGAELGQPLGTGRPTSRLANLLASQHVGFPRRWESNALDSQRVPNALDSRRVSNALRIQHVGHALGIQRVGNPTLWDSNALGIQRVGIPTLWIPNAFPTRWIPNALETRWKRVDT